MTTVTVTRFKPDDAHLAVERIGQITTETQKAASQMATKLSDQEMKKGDVDVETPSKLQKAIADAKKKCGFAGEYAEGTKDKIATMKAQADGIKKHAMDLYSSGKGAYKTYYSDPVNYVKSTKNSIFSQIRSIAGIRFKIDDLLIGEDARKLLMLGIKSICGDGGLGVDGIYGAWAALLNILDNINLFDNSSLLAAIANCSRFTDDHVRVISSKTTIVAEQGNTITYLEMAKIQDVTTTESDLITLCNNSDDNAIDANNIMMIYEETNRSSSTIIMTQVITEEMVEADHDPMQILDIEKVSASGNKTHLVSSVVEDNAYTIDPMAINQASAILVPDPNNSESFHSFLQQSRSTNLGSAETLQKRLNTLGTIKPIVSVDNGPGRKINKTDLMTMKTERVVSSGVPSSWASSASENSSKPNLDSFETISPLDEMKMNGGNMVLVGDPAPVVVEKPDPYAGIPFISFGTRSALSIKPIKDWKVTTDKLGRELRIPIF